MARWQQPGGQIPDGGAIVPNQSTNSHKSDPLSLKSNTAC